MEVFMNLFNDWVGLLSLATILFAILIGGVFAYMFFVKSASEE